MITHWKWGREREKPLPTRCEGKSSVHPSEKMAKPCGQVSTEPQGRQWFWCGLLISVGQIWDVEPLSSDWKAYDIWSWLLSTHLAYPNGCLIILLLTGLRRTVSLVAWQEKVKRWHQIHLKLLGDSCRKLANNPNRKSVKRACYGVVNYFAIQPIETCWICTLTTSGIELFRLLNAVKHEARFPLSIR